LKAAATMKKHKSHARHVFNYLEKNFGIQVVFNDDDSSSKKGGAGDSRKSSGTLTGGKMSNISKTSDIMEGGAKVRGTTSCFVEKPPQGTSNNQRRSKVSLLVSSSKQKKGSILEDNPD
jgi:hypothetical protein